MPRLDEVRQSELKTIEGSPPDLLHPPTGCPFMPRCLYAKNVCRSMPPLEPMPEQATHRKACWVDIIDEKEQIRAKERREARQEKLQSVLESSLKSASAN